MTSRPAHSRRPADNSGRTARAGTSRRFSAHMWPMETIPGLDFTAIDFEAANSDRNSACSAGYATVRDGIITDSGSWLIYPHTGPRSFDAYTMRIHRITPAMTAGAPSLRASMAALCQIIGDGPVLAHNVGFDRAVLQTSCRTVGLPVPQNDFRCTMKLSKAALLPKPRLHLVAEHLGLPGFDKHDAGADALTAARIALAIAHRRGAASLYRLYKDLGVA